jgi:hypothetical protein
MSLLSCRLRNVVTLVAFFGAFATVGLARDWSLNLRQGNQDSARFTLKVKDGRVSIGAKDVSVAEILKDLSQQTGIPIENTLRTEERITIQFSDLPMAEAVASLANVLIFYDKDPGDPTSPRIVKIVVTAKGKGVSAAGLEPTNVSGAGGDAVKIPAPKPFEFVLDPSKPSQVPEKKTRKKN